MVLVFDRRESRTIVIIILRMRGGGIFAGKINMAAAERQMDEETGDPVLKIKPRNERWAVVSQAF